jgi:hypothetical protein
VGEPESLKNGTAQRKVDELNRTVEQRLERLEIEMLSGHNQAFLDGLAWWAKQRRFSFNNSLLIQSQNPNASFVAGYKQFQALGWQVAKGERCIFIRGPWLRKEVDALTGEIEQRLIGYIPLCVFDISQTVEYSEGKRPPDPMQPATGAEWDDLYTKWSRRLTTLYGIEVQEHHIGKVYGLASPTKIRINARLEIGQKATVLIHEATHVIAGHHRDLTKGLQQREMECEATTYVLCAMLGAEHPAAAQYLLNYQIEPNQLTANLETISRLVKEVRAVLHVGFETSVEVVEAVAA